MRAAEEGYGYGHRQVRKSYARQVATGTVTCARCGGLISPDEDWDLGHNDHDRRQYVGPEHAGCNRATAGRRTGIQRRRHSRRW
jgi:hypothetical protein